MKIIYFNFVPDIYKLVEAPEPKGEHAEFMKDRYMRLDKDDRFILQELKSNDLNKKHSAKLFLSPFTPGVISHI